MNDNINIAIAHRSVSEAIFLMRDHFQVTHVTYNFFRTHAVGVEHPWVRTTYSPAWVGHYFIRRLADIDPVVRLGVKQSDPFEWAALTGEDGYHEVFDAAVEHGVGRNGFSIPVIDSYRRRALLSFNSTADDVAWKQMTLANSEIWIKLAHIIHDRAVIEAFGTGAEHPRLGNREIECLSWAARGKGTEETSTILQISQHTVRAYLKTARYKLDCSTISQAVATAIRLQLIDP